MEKKQIRMDGFKGTVLEISEFKFEVTVEDKSPVVVELPNEKWNDSFEYTPSEVAFYKALDLLNL